jgi:hypothetical protein
MVCVGSRCTSGAPVSRSVRQCLGRWDATQLGEMGLGLWFMVSHKWTWGSIKNPQVKSKRIVLDIAKTVHFESYLYKPI